MQLSASEIVLSTTDLQHFKRCRKLFDYSYVRGLSPVGNTSEPMQMGSEFHAILASEAREQYFGEPYPFNPTSPMLDVAYQYVKNHPLPSHIIAAEEPMYTPLLIPHSATPATPTVILRTTLDLVYLRNDVLVGRDYKTFAAAPSMDVDLDFQGSLYATVLAKTYPQYKRHEFEWEYVRRETGRILKAGYKEWPIEDRYINITRVMNDIEIETTWLETQEIALDVVRAIDENRLYRQDLKAGPHSCDNCFFNALCKAEYSQGPLTEGTLSLLAVKNPPRFDDAALIAAQKART